MGRQSATQKAWPQVFLRELVSNAADALEKARFHSVQDETFFGDTKDLEVKIEHAQEADVKLDETEEEEKRNYRDIGQHDVYVGDCP